jgi:hypothetical protein
MLLSNHESNLGSAELRVLHHANSSLGCKIVIRDVQYLMELIRADRKLHAEGSARREGAALLAWSVAKRHSLPLAQNSR